MKTEGVRGHYRGRALNVPRPASQQLTICRAKSGNCWQDYKIRQEGENIIIISARGKTLSIDPRVHIYRSSRKGWVIDRTWYLQNIQNG